MNILYIAYSCNPLAGSEDKIGWNVPYESSKTNNVFIITKEEQRQPIEGYLKIHPTKNIKVYYIDIPDFYKRIFNGFMYSGRLNIWHKRALPLAEKICATEKIDIIHQITPIEFRAIGDYGKIKNIKFICGPLGGGEFLPKGLKDYAKGHMTVEIVRSAINYWYRFKLNFSGKLNRCNYVFFANRETQQFLTNRKRCKCPYELFFDNGLRQDELLDINEIEKRKSLLNNKEALLEKRAVNFLCVGRMIYRKGFSFLLDVLAEIPDSINYKVRILGEGPELEGLRKRCNNDSYLSKHVSFVGSVPYVEIEKEYINADAFIMPSIRETTGTVLLEAMSKGIPVITIDKFGGAILIDENTGWLYSGETKEEYIKSLKEILMKCSINSGDLLRHGIKAQEQAVKYTWKEKNLIYQKIYSKLISN